MHLWKNNVLALTSQTYAINVIEMLFYMQMCLLKIEYMFFFVQELKSHCDAY